MKKIILLSTICLIILFYSFNKTYAKTIVYQDYDVGKNINLITNDLSSFSVNENYHVFNLEKLYQDFSVSFNSSSTKTTSASKVSQTETEFIKNFSLSNGVSESLSTNTFKIALSRSLNYDKIRQSHTYTGFYYYNEIKQTSSSSLVELNSDMYSYYNTDFINLVLSAIDSNSHDDFFNIFEKYGTHIILRATYGSLTYKTAFCSSNDSKIKSFINGDFSSCVSESKTQAIMNSKLNTSLVKYLNTSEFKYNSYYQNITGLISCNDNYLVPIWQYFDTNIQNKMERELEYYTAKSCSNIGISSYENFKFDDEKRITDSGVLNQDKNRCRLYYNYTSQYKNINVKITLEVKQIDKGYSYIYLYNGNEARPDKCLASSPDLGLKKNGDYTSVSYNTTITTSSIDHDLWILYGASGKGSDDWKKRNVTIFLEYYN